jgi:hypothetical protein
MRQVGSRNPGGLRRSARRFFRRPAKNYCRMGSFDEEQDSAADFCRQFSSTIVISV